MVSPLMSKGEEFRLKIGPAQPKITQLFVFKLFSATPPLVVNVDLKAKNFSSKLPSKKAFLIKGNHKNAGQMRVEISASGSTVMSSGNPSLPFVNSEFIDSDGGFVLRIQVTCPHLCVHIQS